MNYNTAKHVSLGVAEILITGPGREKRKRDEIADSEYQKREEEDKRKKEKAKRSYL